MSIRRAGKTQIDRYLVLCDGTFCEEWCETTIQGAVAEGTFQSVVVSWEGRGWRIGDAVRRDLCPECAKREERKRAALEPGAEGGAK